MMGEHHTFLTNGLESVTYREKAQLVSRPGAQKCLLLKKFNKTELI